MSVTVRESTVGVLDKCDRASGLQPDRPPPDLAREAILAPVFCVFALPRALVGIRHGSSNHRVKHLVFSSGGLRHGLDVRGELAVQQRMDGVSGWFVEELDLGRGETETTLHVGARRREHDATSEVGRHRPVNVARDDPPHLRVAHQDLPQPASISGGKTGRGIPRRAPS